MTSKAIINTVVYVEHVDDQHFTYRICIGRTANELDYALELSSVETFDNRKEAQEAGENELNEFIKNPQETLSFEDRED